VIARSDGWSDDRMEGQLDGPRAGQRGGCSDARIHGWAIGWTVRRTNGRTVGRTDCPSTVSRPDVSATPYGWCAYGGLRRWCSNIAWGCFEVLGWCFKFPWGQRPYPNTHPHPPLPDVLRGRWDQGLGACTGPGLGKYEQFTKIYENITKHHFHGTIL
jgi:hypothetical protein